MYDNALEIRDNTHRNPIHEDVLATKFNIAELLESMGEAKTAKEIKQHLLDSIEGTDIDAGAPMGGERRKEINEDRVKTLLMEHNVEVAERLLKEQKEEEKEKAEAEAEGREVAKKENTEVAEEAEVIEEDTEHFK